MVVKAQQGNSYQSYLLIVTLVDRWDYNKIKYNVLGDSMHSVNLICHHKQKILNSFFSFLFAV